MAKLLKDYDIPYEEAPFGPEYVKALKKLAKKET
jgi:hypothetical protein